MADSTQARARGMKALETYRQVNGMTGSEGENLTDLLTDLQLYWSMISATDDEMQSWPEIVDAAEVNYLEES